MLKQEHGQQWDCVPFQQQRGGQWLPMPLKQSQGGTWRLVGCGLDAYIKWLQPTAYYPMNDAPGDQLIDAMGNMDLDRQDVGTPPNPAFEVMTSGGPDGGAYIEFHGNWNGYKDKANGSFFKAVASGPQQVQDAKAVSLLALARSNHAASSSWEKSSLIAGIAAQNARFLCMVWDAYQRGVQTSHLRQSPVSGDWHQARYHDFNPADVFVPENEWHLMAVTHSDAGAGTVQINAYRDGVLIESVDALSGCGGWETIAHTFEIGGSITGAATGDGARLWDGGIAHVAFWNRTLSAEEIKMVAKAAGVFA